jgi:glycine oxidase
MLAPYIEGHASALLDLCLAGFERYEAFVANVRQRSGRPVEYACDGALLVAHDEAGRAEIADTCARLSAAGAAHEELDGAGVLALESGLSGAIDAGLLVRPHGYVHVGALVEALVASASARGAEFVRAGAEAVESGRAGAVVVAGERRHEADAVVLAAGCWSGRVRGAGAALPARPVRGQLVHLRFDRPPLGRIVWGPGCYLVPWRDGTLLAGATVEDAGFDERPTVEGVRGMLEGAHRLLPGADRANFEGVRVGLRPASGDELPVVGPSSTMPRVFHASGHYRNGVLLAPLTAALVADLVLDGRESPALAATLPARFGC